MKLFLDVLSVLYFFWPLILLVCFIRFRFKGDSFTQRLLKAARQVFLAWCLAALLALTLVLFNHGASSFLPEPYNRIAFFTLGAVTGTVTLASAIQRYRQDRREMQLLGSLEYLKALPPAEFEALTARFFQSLGYRTRPYEEKQDHGVDVIVYDGKGEKWIVQCKRYQGTVGEPILRDLLGAMLHEKASRAFLMTTGRLSQKARAWIADKPITVYEGEALVRLLKIDPNSE